MLFIFSIGGFLFYFKNEIGKATGSGKIVQVEIEKGESVSSISKKLESKGLVNSSVIFYLYERIKDKKIVAGKYLIPDNLTLVEIANVLEKGERQVRRITIPEGWRMEQMATYLEANTGILALDFLQEAQGKEGKLFPDTYELMDQPTAKEVIKKMDDNYLFRISELLPTDDQLVLASIVEREAASDSERADIAGVFANRLKIGMKLEADPTVQYQKDSNNYPQIGLISYDFWQKLAIGDLRGVQGPYNTYLHSGLPPSPICNPGLASIEAAVNPAQHDYYYFLHGSDGNIYFSKNEAEHNRKKAEYL
ncbi:MAG: endolytic transglycosylase MltG [Patescibacteria group bacterium]|nr:endolytic transglycosylase MltG [Patescibacteria group bacterium]HPL01533.1 endolytic transglycosylase MltG [bacterium]